MGRSKNRPAVKSNVKYTEQQLICAIEEVKNGSTQFAAAKRYNIPRSTLFNKISGKTILGKKSGPGTVLSSEEENIVKKWMFALGERGFPVTKGQLLRSIQLYLNVSKRKTIFTNNFPGRKWLDSFLTRHPRIRERLSQNLTPSRAAVTADNIRFWHAEIQKYCEENDLLDALSDPSRVFNMDEKGFFLTKKSEVVLVEKGTKAVYSRSKNDEKECVTALLGGSASGKPTPPMVVHSYKRMPSNILLNLPPKWSIGISDNGWQTQQTFYDYMTNIFYPWLLEEKIQLPVIVFIDGHKSHVSINLSDFCAANQIVLIGLYPNSTHLTQPMDVGVFKSLNTSWETTAKEWRVKEKFRKIEKKDVAPILNDSIGAIGAEEYSKLLTTAFKSSGLFPFNADNINFNRILPSLAACATSQDELWNTTESNVSESNKVASEINIEENVYSRLKHIESLIGDSVLTLFRSSGDNWSGATEYLALFNIWKQMYKATQVTSTVNSNIIIVDIDCQLDNCIQGEPGELILEDDDTWLIEEDCTITNTDDAVIHEHSESVSTEQYVGENYLFPVTANSICDSSDYGEQSDDSEVSEYINLKLGPVVMHSNEFHIVEQRNDDINITTKPIGQQVDESANPANAGLDAVMIHVENEHNKEELSVPIGTNCIGDRSDNGMQLFDAKGVNEPAKDIIPNVISEFIGKDTVAVANCNGFNPDAFKSSFYWPVIDKKKKQKSKPPKEKQSSVFSGDAWRDSERKKLEEKLKEEANKKARKEEREKKKENAAKIAVEKKILKEKKVLEAAKMAAEKEKKRLDKQRARAQKRTYKATPILQ